MPGARVWLGGGSGVVLGARVWLGGGSGAASGARVWLGGGGVSGPRGAGAAGGGFGNGPAAATTRPGGVGAEHPSFYAEVTAALPHMSSDGGLPHLARQVTDEARHFGRQGATGEGLTQNVHLIATLTDVARLIVQLRPNANPKLHIQIDGGHHALPSPPPLLTLVRPRPLAAHHFGGGRAPLSSPADAMSHATNGMSPASPLHHGAHPPHAPALGHGHGHGGHTFSTPGGDGRAGLGATQSAPGALASPTQVTVSPRSRSEWKPTLRLLALKAQAQKPGKASSPLFTPPNALVS